MTNALPRRRLGAILLGSILTCGPAWRALANARPARDAGTFVAQLAQDAIDKLSTPNLGEDERVQRLRGLFADGFDIPLIARFVLGRYWRMATEPERKEYVDLFRELVIVTYARRFHEFTSARLRVLSVSRPNEDNDVIVAVELAVP
jgi:phospholipid transport system substrate-binding protein